MTYRSNDAHLSSNFRGAHFPLVRAEGHDARVPRPVAHLRLPLACALRAGHAHPHAAVDPGAGEQQSSSLTAGTLSEEEAQAIRIAAKRVMGRSVDIF